MDKFKVNKNSWHWKLYKWYVTEKYNEEYNSLRNFDSLVKHRLVDIPTNFCAYWRAAFIKPLFSGILGIFLWLMIPYLFITSPSYAIAAFYVLKTMILLVCGIIVIVIIKYISDYFCKEKPKIKKEPGFFHTKYKSWKNKVCPLIEIGDE